LFFSNCAGFTGGFGHILSIVYDQATKNILLIINCPKAFEPSVSKASLVCDLGLKTENFMKNVQHLNIIICAVFENHFVLDYR